MSFDPSYSNTRLLIRAESGALVDESQYAHTITGRNAGGVIPLTPFVENGQQFTGTPDQSAYNLVFDGVRWFDVGPAATLSLNVPNWGVEGYLTPSASAPANALEVVLELQDRFRIVFWRDFQLMALQNTAGTDIVVLSTPANTSRFHWAFVRRQSAGGSIVGHINGTILDAAQASFASSSNLRVGNNWAANAPLYAKLDDLRIKDIETYTANFTPPGAMPEAPTSSTSVQATGFSTTQFGAARVSRTANASGFSSTQIGTASLRRTVVATSLVATPTFGTAVIDQTTFARPTGIASTVFGSPVITTRLEPTTQYVASGSDPSTAFGDASVVLRRTFSAVGLNATVIPAPAVRGVYVASPLGPAATIGNSRASVRTQVPAWAGATPFGAAVARAGCLAAGFTSTVFGAANNTARPGAAGFRSGGVGAPSTATKIRARSVVSARRFGTAQVERS